MNGPQEVGVHPATRAPTSGGTVGWRWGGVVTGGATVQKGAGIDRLRGVASAILAPEAPVATGAVLLQAASLRFPLECREEWRHGMGSANKLRREFRAICASGDPSLFDLHRAYWNGKFERGTRSCIQCIPPGLDEPCEAPRDFVSRWIGWGNAWIPLNVRKARSGSSQWKAMARISELDFKDFAPHWLRTFGRFTIPKSDLDKWIQKRSATGEDNPVRRKIESVLRAGARIAKQPPKRSGRGIAQRLVDEDRAEGYSFESVKKILYGTLPAQRDRDIPGLTGWVRQHP